MSLNRRWLITVLLMALLAMTLAACGGGNRDEAPSDAATPAQPTLPPTATAAPPTATPLPPTSTPAPTDTPPAANTADDSAVAGLPDLRLPDDARDVTYEYGAIGFSSATGVEELADFYRDALVDDDWEELTELTQVDDAFGFVQFARGDESIYLTIFGQEGASDVSVDLSEAPSISGFVEEEATPAPVAGAAGLTIADMPTPPEAYDVAVNGNNLSFKAPLTLAEVAAFYHSVYQELELDTDCLEDVADYTSVSCSFSDGDVTVSFFAFEGFDDTEVEIEVINYALEQPDDDGELGVVDEEGLPLPDDHTGYTSEGGTFARTVTVSSPSDLDTLLAFFEAELDSRGWTLDDSELADDAATLRYSGPDGELVVELQAGDETEVVLTQRNREAAEEAGILPPAGQVRLYFVNFSDGPLTVEIDGQVVEVPFDPSMESETDAPSLELAPGTYDVITTVDGVSVTDELTFDADEVWGLLLDSQGALPLIIF